MQLMWLHPFAQMYKLWFYFSNIIHNSNPKLVSCLWFVCVCVCVTLCVLLVLKIA